MGDPVPPCRSARAGEGSPLASPDVDFRTVDFAELSRRVRERDVSARELTEAALIRIAAVDPAVRAFVAVDADGARRQADEVDRLLAALERATA